MEEDTSAISFNRSKKMTVLSVLFSPLLIAAGFWLLVGAPGWDHDPNENHRRGAAFIAFLYETFGLWIFQAFGLLLVGFAGMLLVHSVRGLISPRPDLILSSEGITDNTTLMSVGFIPWADVVGLRARGVMKQVFVDVQVSDPQKYQSGSIIKRFFRATNRVFGVNQISINVNGLTESRDVIVATIGEYFTRYQTQSDEKWKFK